MSHALARKVEHVNELTAIMHRELEDQAELQASVCTDLLN